MAKHLIDRSYGLISEAISKPGDADFDKLKQKKPGEIKKYSEHEPLLLGQLMMLHIGKIFGLRAEVGMEEYRSHLQSVAVLPEVDKNFDAFGRRLLEEMRNSFNQQGFTDQEWFSEVPFLPSVQQVELVADLWRNKEQYEKLVHQIGYRRGMDALIREVVQNKDFRYLPMRVRAGDVSTGLDLAEMSQVENPEYKWLGKKQINLIKRLVAVASYVHFDFDLDWNKDEILKEVGEHAEKWKRVVMTGSARVDLFGLGAKEGDRNASTVIQKFAAILRQELPLGSTREEVKKKYHFGKRPLHALAHYSTQERETVQELIQMIAEGRVGYRLVEVKGSFAKENKQPKTGLYLKNRFEADRVLDRHFEDVAHSLFAMWQWLRLVGHDERLAEATNMPEGLRGGLRQLMRGQVDAEPTTVRALVVLMKTFLRGTNRVYLARNFYPILEKSDRSDWTYSSEQNFAIHQLSSRRLVREMGEVGKRMLRAYLQRD